MADPGHVAPPMEGAGLSQVRVRVCVPPPHVTEQGPNEDHSDHIPSTGSGRFKNPQLGTPPPMKLPKPAAEKAKRTRLYRHPSSRAMVDVSNRFAATAKIAPLPNRKDNA